MLVHSAKYALLSVNNVINELPVKSKKVKQRERNFTYLYIEYEGKIAIHQRGAGDIWQGLWEFPQAEQLTSSEDSAWKTEAQLLQKEVKHILTHQILLADIYLWRPKNRPQLPSEFIWIEKQDLEKYALPRLIEILLKAVPA